MFFYIFGEGNGAFEIGYIDIGTLNHLLTGDYFLKNGISSFGLQIIKYNY